MRATIALLAAVMWTGTSLAETTVIDGDTLKIDGETIRIKDLDTPETRGAECLAEDMLASRAKIMLDDMVYEATSIAITKRYGKDRYGRTLADVSINGGDVKTAMIAARLGVKWEGKQADWCGPLE